MAKSGAIWVSNDVCHYLSKTGSHESVPIDRQTDEMRKESSPLQKNRNSDIPKGMMKFEKSPHDNYRSNNGSS